jgi:hypothetical protein
LPIYPIWVMPISLCLFTLGITTETINRASKRMSIG